jgi:hypothetical protein
MSASIGAATSGSRPELVTATYRRFQQLGFDDPEAANLAAIKSGFPVGSRPWKVRELAHLLFLRDLASARGEWSGAGDRASTHVGDGWRLPARTARYTDQADSRITLLTLFQAAAGSTATLDRIAPRALRPPRDLRHDRREGW